MKKLKKIKSDLEATEFYVLYYASESDIAVARRPSVVATYEDGTQKGFKLQEELIDGLIDAKNDNGSNIVKLEIVHDVKVIQPNVFNGCNSLTSVTIGSCVKHIVGSSFVNCENLTSVTIYEGVGEIGSFAFNGCENLTNLTIPAHASLMEGTFGDCKRLVDVTYNGTMEEFDRANSMTIGYLCCRAHCVDGIRYVGQLFRFLDIDGTLLNEQILKHSETPYLPQEPYKEGWTFDRWDCVSDSVFAPSTDYYPIYTCTIRFLDDDDSVINEQTVEYGQDLSDFLSILSEPYKEGYTFIGWDTDITEITGNTDYHAQYEVNTYTITFYCNIDNSEISRQDVEYDKMPMPPSDDELYVEGYTFIGWDSYITEAYEDKDYYAQYEVNTYTIRFLDEYGSVIDEQTVSYGQYPLEPSEPYKEGYTFIGWDSDITEAYEDKDYYARYEEI